jgi:hypothetical protein
MNIVHIVIGEVVISNKTFINVISKVVISKVL